jgi:hypothetical protein
MKCPRCWALNSDNDTVCVGCGRVVPPQIVTPQWAYIFATACGIIPVVALGGLIPVAIGVSGASGCVGVARLVSLPSAVRLLGCIGITLLCWFLFLGLIAVMMAGAKH